MEQSESGTATNPQATFNEWLKLQAAKSKTSVILKGTYDLILKFLKRKNEGLGVHDIPRKIEKRIKRNNYQLINYPMLNLFDVLCVPSTETTEVSFSHFWSFSHQLATFVFDEGILSASSHNLGRIFRTNNCFRIKCSHFALEELSL